MVPIVITLLTIEDPDATDPGTTLVADASEWKVWEMDYGMPRRMKFWGKSELLTAPG